MIKRLLLAWRIASRVPSLPTEVPAWEKENAAALREFLASETGLKLGTMLRHLIVTQSMAAMGAESSRLFWQCGHASGVRWAAELLDQLGQWESEITPGKDDRPSENLNWLHGKGRDDDGRSD